MRDIAASEAAPSVTRVSDAYETRFSFATRKDPTPVDRVKSKALQAYLRRAKGFDVDDMCLSFIGYEGTEAHVAAQRKLVGRIVSAHGGLCIGQRTWGALRPEEVRHPVHPGLPARPRDARPTSRRPRRRGARCRGVYAAVMDAARGAFADLGVPGYVMCHLSHSYHGGACLYFTFAFRPFNGGDPLDQYARVKNAIQQAFVDSGATLSHHHAVGTEHAPWLEDDISAPGVAMLRALFDGVDPGGNLNPGKIV